MSGEELRAAAQAVVDAAETDDDFDGQFIDWMVPDEKITALRAALAAPSTPEPIPASATDVRAAYRATDNIPDATLATPSTPEPSGLVARIEALRRYDETVDTMTDDSDGAPQHLGIYDPDAVYLADVLAVIRAAPSTEPALDAALLHRAIVMTLPFEKWISPETAASIAAEYARLAESQP